MPTFIVYRNGQRVKEIIGANQRDLQFFLQESRRK